MSLFKALFLTRASLLEADENNTGLVSPYLKDPKDILAMASDELASNIRDIGKTISDARRRTAAKITLLKKLDPRGFLEFRDRIVDTLALNNILPENESLREQLAEVLACAYAEVSKKDGFLVYSDKGTATKIATAILSAAKGTGLNIKSGKIINLLKDVLLTVLNVPEKNAKKP